MGRVSGNLKWRIYADGIVVFVPATCETHILSTALAPLFVPDAEVMAIGDDLPVSGIDLPGSGPAPVRVPALLLERLGSMKIVEAFH